MNEEEQNKINELFNQSPKEVQDIILGDELDNVAIDLGNKYKLHVDLLTHLKDVIILILVGATATENALASLKEHLKLDDETTLALAKDLNVSIFQKARITLLGKELVKDEVKMISLGDNKEANKAALREQITNRHKMVSILDMSPAERLATLKKEKVVGSRAQLMEQLDVLEAIPTDEDVENRLNDIKAKIFSINSASTPVVETEENTEVRSETKESFAEMGDTIMDTTPKVASYSKAPTRYNIDPYRELSE